MPWILKLKSDWSFLGRYLEGVRRFKEVTAVQSNARIAAEDDNVEHKDIFAALLKAKDPDTGRSFTTSEMVSEAGFLLIAGRATFWHCKK